MKRGFTLVEMVIAVGISTILFAAIMVVFMEVWTITKNSADELQCTIKARHIREKLLYTMSIDDSSRTNGLISATNIAVTSSSIYAKFKYDAPLLINANDATDHVRYMLDKNRSPSDFCPESCSLQYIYLAVEWGKAVYYDRMVVPVFGRHVSEDEFNGHFTTE